MMAVHRIAAQGFQLKADAYGKRGGLGTVTGIID